MADLYTIKRTTAVDVSNAIRERTGGTETYGSDEWGAAIRGLPQGGNEPYVEYTVSANGTVTAAALYGFTGVPSYMFYRFTGLQSVDFSGSPALTSIGTYAFASCGKLNNVVLPTSITEIGSYAFNSCSSLSTIRIPESVDTIEDRAFRNCAKLRRVEIAAERLGPGRGIFEDCTGLEDVWIRDTCLEITAATATAAPFIGCDGDNDITFWVEANSTPSGWGTYWSITGDGEDEGNVVYNTTSRPW